MKSRGGPERVALRAAKQCKFRIAFPVSACARSIDERSASLAKSRTTAGARGRGRGREGPAKLWDSRQALVGIGGATTGASRLLKKSLKKSLVFGLLA